MQLQRLQFIRWAIAPASGKIFVKLISLDRSAFPSLLPEKNTEITGNYHQFTYHLDLLKKHGLPAKPIGRDIIHPHIISFIMPVDRGVWHKLMLQNFLEYQHPYVPSFLFSPTACKVFFAPTLCLERSELWILLHGSLCRIVFRIFRSPTLSFLLRSRSRPCPSVSASPVAFAPLLSK